MQLININFIKEVPDDSTVEEFKGHKIRQAVKDTYKVFFSELDRTPISNVLPLLATMLVPVVINMSESFERIADALEEKTKQ